jgi:sulfatase maturation enzyme AslB (radical SAM superfamily)
MPKVKVYNTFLKEFLKRQNTTAENNKLCQTCEERDFCNCSKASDREGNLEKSELTKNCAIYGEYLLRKLKKKGESL